MPSPTSSTGPSSRVDARDAGAGAAVAPRAPIARPAAPPPIVRKKPRRLELVAMGPSSRNAARLLHRRRAHRVPGFRQVSIVMLWWRDWMADWAKLFKTGGSQAV